MPSRLCGMLIALAGVGLRAVAFAAAPQPIPAVEAVVPCFAVPAATTQVDYRYDCGYVVVRENRAMATGRTVKLGYLRLRSRSATREPPLFMLAGGPGGSMIVSSVFDLFQGPFLGPVLDRRDVVVLDQRGTRHTLPHLECPGFTALSWNAYAQKLSADAGAAVERSQLDRCVRGFRQQGIDLAQYNSVVIAADVDDARRALGYDKIVYYGASYGSQLGQHVMRDFPSMLHAVVLDGSSALSRKSWAEDRAIDVEFSLRQLDTLCREDEKCRKAYDLPTLLSKGLALFDRGPISASFVDPRKPGQKLPIEVTQNDFADFVYEKLGYKYGVSALPFILSQLTKDGRNSMGPALAEWRGEKLLAARGGSSGDLAIGMYAAVVCSDDPVRSPGEVIREGAGPLPLLFADAVARGLVRICQAVGVPSLPDSTDVNVRSDIPTLILSGRLDAQTPTFRSEEVAKTLGKAQVVVFPDGTHVQIAAVNRCAMNVMTQFLDDPLRRVNTECLRDNGLPGFVLPDGTVSSR